MPDPEDGRDGQPPRAAFCSCCGGGPRDMPVVHKGFAMAYETAGPRRRILKLVNDLLANGSVDKGDAHVYVTGHSQGAAVAAMCAGAALHSCAAHRTFVAWCRRCADACASHRGAPAARCVLPVQFCWPSCLGCIPDRT